MYRKRTLALAIAILAGASASSRAQFAPSIPYSLSNSPYQSFSYPTIVNPALPNQARFNLYGPPNQGPLSLDMPDSNGLTGGRFDRQLSIGRGTSRYGTADSEFGDNVQSRDDLYEQWVQETDPAKRAEIAKELQTINEKLRGSTVSRRRGSGAGEAHEGDSASDEESSRFISSRRRGNTASSLNQKPANRPTNRTGPRGGGSVARPTNAARPDAPSNRTAGPSATPSATGRPGSRGTARPNANATINNPARPTSATGRPATPGATQPGTKPESEKPAHRTPEEVLERSRALDAQAGSGSVDPGVSDFNPGRAGNASSIGRSRFGTGQPSSGSNSRPRP